MSFHDSGFGCSKTQVPWLNSCTNSNKGCPLGFGSQEPELRIYPCKPDTLTTLIFIQLQFNSSDSPPSQIDKAFHHDEQKYDKFQKGFKFWFLKFIIYPKPNLIPKLQIKNLMVFFIEPFCTFKGNQKCSAFRAFRSDLDWNMQCVSCSKGFAGHMSFLRPPSPPSQL